ncbi:MAG TPA: efflux RND transporter periplasmic adaptor subunit [Parafilimonas sp.]|nr:efflux RND transporter periplasmic adaptor subunit [Parafilimonas sp.]
MQTLIKFLSVLLITISFAACNSKADTIEETTGQAAEDSVASNEVEFTDAQYKTAGIELGKVEMKQISGTFKANGMLDVPPQQKVSISIPMGGFLKKTDLLEGKFVSKGELIAVIENPDFIGVQQDYLDAKSQLEFAKTDYERQQELAKENVNAQKTLQRSKATYNSLLAKVNGLREKIKVSGLSLSAVDNGNITPIINIYAPISGYVTEVNANIGKYVTSIDVLFEIVDTRHLHAELTVFEKDVPKLKIGQTVRFTLANETKERTAKVYLIGREISADRTVQIHCHIDNEDNQLLPGLFLKALVESGAQEVTALPNDAIIDYAGEKYIFIVSTDKPAKDSNAAGEHHFIMMPVQVGDSELNYTEVVLPENFDKANTEVVVKGAYSLLSKMKNSEEEEE